MLGNGARQVDDVVVQVVGTGRGSDSEQLGTGGMDDDLAKPADL
jgi:hypothetical protein